MNGSAQTGSMINIAEIAATVGSIAYSMSSQIFSGSVSMRRLAMKLVVSATRTVAKSSL
jgi:hypothetical protein